jgi:Tol biopolymer transport system component
MHKRTLQLFLLAVLLVFAGRAAAFNNPSLKWETIKTPHFEVHYHQGAEWTAEQVAKILEEINGPITGLYQYEPSYPVHFIIRDTHDYANGAAYFYENKVEIWATNLEFGFRGTTDWLRNVVTHEYTHIVSIQAGTRLPQRIPAAYFQLISFEDEKRSDVLQGYPKDLVTFPFSGVMMPPWFAEGVSQYQSPDVQYDCWDAHRDMILRCAVLEDKMLTYDQMGFFGKNGLQAEQVYDHGYGLVSYIASTYGPDAIRQTTQGLKTIYHLNMNGALKAGTGKTGQELYGEWRSHLQTRYDEQTAPIRENELAGEVIASGGYMTVAPTLSPDGKQVAYLSNVGNDYSGTALFMKPLGEKRARTLKAGVSSPPQFSRDGQKLVYSKKDQIDRYGSVVNDLYVYDIDRKKEKRLTKASRAAHPDFSPDGEQIIAVVNSDGTHSMVVMDSDGKNQRVLLERTKGTQIYYPHFSPDGQRILFGIFDGATRDLAVVSADGSGFEYVLQTQHDERDARWLSDNRIVFVSNRTGIFNIYELDLSSGWVAQRSNVIGGAFLPDVSGDGAVIVYTSYAGDGYGVSQLEGTSDPVQTLDRVSYGQRAAGEFDECVTLRANALARGEGQAMLALASDDPSAVSGQIDATQDSSSSSAAKFTNQKYKSAYTPFHLYPRFVIWDSTFRLGLAASSFEILDKQSMFFGGSYGTDKEFDGFLSYEIRNFYPTLFVDALYVRERTDDTAFDDEPASPSFQHSFAFDLRYDLWIADLGLKFELSEAFSFTHQNEISLYWSHSEYSVNISGEELDEDGDLVTPFDGGWKYYIGNQANLKWTLRSIRRAVDAGINPHQGRQLSLWYMRAWDDLFENGEFEYGFRPVFTANNYNQYTVDLIEFIGLPWFRHSLRVRLHGSVIDKDVDSFFWVYMGGRDGIRGYNYYSIGGRKGAVASVTYRFPIIRNFDRQFLSMYFRDAYGSVFYEAAAAWDGLPRFPGEELWKDSAGWELRFNLGAYYVFPTAVSIVGAYAFDPTFFIDPGFGLIRPVTQEPGWTYYFTVGFGFEI